MKKIASHRICLFAITLVLPILDAQGCSCLALSDQEKFVQASKVFIGTVVETKLFVQTDDPAISIDKVTAKVKIKQTIKGEAGQSLSVVDDVADGANCGLGLLTGRDYLFYLSAEKTVSICDGTRLYNEITDIKTIDDMQNY